MEVDCRLDVGLG